MDTGIRGPGALNGPLLFAADPLSAVDVQATHAAITSGCWPWGDPPEEYLPERMHCPYPWPEDAARSLRCGRGAECAGPAQRVSMIGYGIDADLLYRLDEIAFAGGDSGARVANEPAELRAQLESLFDEFAAAP